VRIDLRWGDGDINRIRALAPELVSLQPDIILTAGTPATVAVQRETRTIPIVFVIVADPVAVQTASPYESWILNTLAIAHGAFSLDRSACSERTRRTLPRSSIRSRKTQRSVMLTRRKPTVYARLTSTHRAQSVR
jgi:hypothetical protein